MFQKHNTNVIQNTKCRVLSLISQTDGGLGLNLTHPMSLLTF